MSCRRPHDFYSSFDTQTQSSRMARYNEGFVNQTDIEGRAYLIVWVGYRQMFSTRSISFHSFYPLLCRLVLLFASGSSHQFNKFVCFPLPSFLQRDGPWITRIRTSVKQYVCVPSRSSTNVKPEIPILLCVFLSNPESSPEINSSLNRILQLRVRNQVVPLHSVFPFTSLYTR